MTDKDKLKEIKKLADAMYYAAFNLTTDASMLKKAMKEYHQFIINEYCREEPVSEELEYASEKYACRFSSSKYGHDKIKATFKASAQWQKEQMMKDAINGHVIEDVEEGEGDFLLSTEYLPKSMGLKDQQKVKVIVIKED